jgi:hypothetical protein
MAVTLEVLHRTWHIEARSVRPDHRMVGHTGFLTTARLLAPTDEPAPYNARKYGAPGDGTEVMGTDAEGADGGGVSEADDDAGLGPAWT